MVFGLCIGVVLASCARSEIENATSCTELEDAWKAAGGLQASSGIQLDTMDRVNELARESDLSLDELRTCFDLFLEAQRASNCTRTDLEITYLDEYCEPVRK